MDIFKISVPTGTKVGTFDNTTLNQLVQLDHSWTKKREQSSATWPQKSSWQIFIFVATLSIFSIHIMCSTL